ncbi:hypothetical protein HDU76_000508 [Blyttiomyces sp. JEL0837]|nr:hypothetical protein HDU76_000508 [Blyttiomyces sp. JEL0837]
MTDPNVVTADDRLTQRGSKDAAYTKRRTIAFTASLFCMTCAGTLYLFGTYSPGLKESLGLSETQMNIVASAGGFGLYLCSPIMGNLADRFSANTIVAASGSFLFFGYVAMALASRGYFPTHYLLVSLYYACVGIGSSGVFNSALATNVRNFLPQDHGFAVGLSVSFFGLSAFFFTQISNLFQIASSKLLTAPSGKLNVYGFLIFMGIFTGAVSFCASFFVFDTSKYLEAKREDEPVPVNDEEESLLANASQSDLVNSQPPPIVVPTSVSIFEDSDAWILFPAFLVLTGTGLMYINNIGSIVSYLGDPANPGAVQSARTVQVSLLSICNCAGRIITGLGSDYLGRKYNMPRLYGLICGAGLIAVTQMMGISVTSIGWLSVSTALLGLGYGAIFSATPAIVSSWFGVKKFGSNWGWFQWAPAFGGQICNKENITNG